MKNRFKRQPGTFRDAAASAEGTQPIGHRRSSKRRTKLLIPVLVVLVGVLIAALVIRNLTKPAVGSINQLPPSSAVKQTPYSQPGTYKGKYVSFSYPAFYKSNPTQLSGDYLEVVSYSSTALTSNIISVGVSRGSLSNDGGVSYREAYPSIYKLTTSRLGLEFVRLDGTEDTFYLQHDGLVASVAVSSPGKDLGTDAEYVASSLRWQ